MEDEYYSDFSYHINESDLEDYYDEDDCFDPYDYFADNSNGYSNGYSNGHSNGYSKVNFNGHSNGFSNEYSNGYVSETANSNERHIEENEKTENDNSEIPNKSDFLSTEKEKMKFEESENCNNLLDSESSLNAAPVSSNATPALVDITKRKHEKLDADSSGTVTFSDGTNLTGDQIAQLINQLGKVVREEIKKAFDNYRENEDNLFSLDDNPENKAEIVNSNENKTGLENHFGDEDHEDHDPNSVSESDYEYSDEDSNNESDTESIAEVDNTKSAKNKNEFAVQDPKVEPQYQRPPKDQWKSTKKRKKAWKKLKVGKYGTIGLKAKDIICFKIPQARSLNIIHFLLMAFL